jgi:hypothetical protein
MKGVPKALDAEPQVASSLKSMLIGDGPVNAIFSHVGKRPMPYLIRNDELIRMNPESLTPMASDTGWANTRLMETAAGALFLVRGDELIKMNSKTLTPQGRDTGWQNARMMLGTSSSLFLVRGEELIRMSPLNLRPERRDTGWDSARMLFGAGAGLFLLRDDELIRMNAHTLIPEAIDTGWQHARLILGTSDAVFVVRDDDLYRLNSRTLRVEGHDTGWANARFVVATNDALCLVRDDDLIRLNPRTLTCERVDSGWANAISLESHGQKLFLLRDGELIRMNIETLTPESSDPGWANSSPLSGSVMASALGVYISTRRLQNADLRLLHRVDALRVLTHLATAPSVSNAAKMAIAEIKRNSRPYNIYICRSALDIGVSIPNVGPLSHSSVTFCPDGAQAITPDNRQTPECVYIGYHPGSVWQVDSNRYDVACVEVKLVSATDVAAAIDAYPTKWTIINNCHVAAEQVTRQSSTGGENDRVIGREDPIFTGDVNISPGISATA